MGICTSPETTAAIPGAADELRAERAAGAQTILDDNLLPPEGRELLCKDARR